LTFHFINKVAHFSLVFISALIFLLHTLHTLAFYLEVNFNFHSCNRPVYVCSSPGAILNKATREYKVQPSGRQTSWSECSSLIYGNCVQQYNHPNVILHGSDTLGLDMEIACSKSATAQTLGQHSLDATLFREEYLANLESRLHSCPSRRS
jgi:hypothetical protein